MSSRRGIVLLSLLCTACLGSTYKQEKEIGEVADRINYGMTRIAFEELAARSGADQAFRMELGPKARKPGLAIAKEKDHCTEKAKRIELAYWRGGRAFLAEFDVFVIVEFDAHDVVCAYDVIPFRR